MVWINYGRKTTRSNLSVPHKKATTNMRLMDKWVPVKIAF